MLKPTRGYVLIEPEKSDDKSSGGIYLPENAQEKPQKGTIIARGDYINKDNEIIPYPDAVEGDKVFYKRWGGEDLKHDGKEYKIVKYEDIVAVYE